MHAEPSPEPKRAVEDLLKQLGLNHFGFAKLERPFSMSHYIQWIQDGCHADMDYLVSHLEQKEAPQLLLPLAESAIVVAAPYFSNDTQNLVPSPRTAHEDAGVAKTFEAARISMYAKGEDYHRWFKQELNNLCEALRKIYPNHKFLPFVDSSPVLERDLAYRAGMGWIGKNTCLIHPKKGSLFFLGEIYTTLNLATADLPMHDFCGTCRRCIDACPTQALIDERKLDARKCISYLTIESKQVDSIDLRQQSLDWLFGCDICQTVCPWNLKVHGKGAFQHDPLAQRKKLVEELNWILTTSNKEIDRTLRVSPLARAGGRGLKRNALVVIANLKLTECLEAVNKLCEHERLGSLARQTVKTLVEENVEH